MIPYVEKFIAETELKLSGIDPADIERAVTMKGLEQMKENVARLKPITETSDLNLKNLEEREVQMADMVRKFKKHLMIEKIKIEE